MSSGSNGGSLIVGCEMIEEICGALNVTQIITDRAKTYFQKLHIGLFLSECKTVDKAAACVYIACRKVNIPRTIKEIVAVSGVDDIKIWNCFKSIQGALKIHLNIPNTDEFIPGFCVVLELSRKIEDAATQIANRAVDMNLVTNRPAKSIAAAAIYLALRAFSEKRQLKRIAEVAGCSLMSIYYLYTVMAPHAKEIFSENLTIDTSLDDNE